MSEALSRFGGVAPTSHSSPQPTCSALSVGVPAFSAHSPTLLGEIFGRRSPMRSS